MSGDEIQRLISIFSNGGASAPALVAFIMTGWLLLRRRTQLSRSAKNLCTGLFMQSTGEIIRIGYWFPALWLSRPGYHYHAWFIEHRYLSYGISLPFLAIGTWMILQELFPKRRQIINWLVGAGFVLAAAFTAAFQASESGLWDRQIAVDWFDSVFIYEDLYERPR